MKGKEDMPKQERSEYPDEMNEDEVVQHLVPDPSAVPEVKILSGFLGKSSRDGHWRLYLTPELSEYIEIPEEAVLRSQKLDNEQSPLGGTILWINRNAELVHTRTKSVAAQAEFLQGSITASFLRGLSVGAIFGSGSVGGVGGLKTFSVTECATCPTEDDSHTCVPAVCTLASSCLTTVPTDPGCGERLGF